MLVYTFFCQVWLKKIKKSLSSCSVFRKFCESTKKRAAPLHLLPWQRADLPNDTLVAIVTAQASYGKMSGWGKNLWKLTCSPSESCSGSTDGSLMFYYMLLADRNYRLLWLLPFLSYLKSSYIKSTYAQLGGKRRALSKCLKGLIWRMQPK